MGWGVRKSFGSKAFRVNVSKSGIGFSTGVKGFRVSTSSRGTYVQVGAGGVYYRQRIGGQTSSRASRPSVGGSYPYQNPLINGLPDNLNPIHSASADALIDDNSAAILARINTTLKAPVYCWAVVLLTILMTFGTLAVQPWISLTLFIIGVVFTVISYQADVKRRTFPLFYEFDPVSLQQWEALNLALHQLAKNHRLWRVLAEGAVYDWKRSAGATSNLRRMSVSIRPSKPPYIATNLNPFCLHIGIQCLCFLPDRLLIYENGKYGAIDYSALHIQIDSVNFIERLQVPSDATIVGTTWQYVNKDGGPDRRFNNNLQLPICSYQTIHLSSGHGLNIYLHASSHAFRGIPAYGRTKTSTGSAATGQPQFSYTSHATVHPIPPCYTTLGLALNCSANDAQAAYRSLAKNYHPDVVAHLAPEFRQLAEERMKEINEAYTELRKLRSW